MLVSYFTNSSHVFIWSKSSKHNVMPVFVTICNFSLWCMFCASHCEYLTIPDAFSLPLFNSHIGILYAAIRSKHQLDLQWIQQITSLHVQQAHLSPPGQVTDPLYYHLEVRPGTDAYSLSSIKKTLSLNFGTHRGHFQTMQTFTINVPLYLQHILITKQ